MADQTGQIGPRGLLAVFTNKAAREMLIRISGMLPINTAQWVQTFTGCAIDSAGALPRGITANLRSQIPPTSLP
jgi:hypothetical protein